MKKILTLLLFISFCISVSAQKAPDLSRVSLNTESEAHEAEPLALEAANYLLNNPFDKTNADQLKTATFIGMWMEKTPDYMYDINESTAKLFLENKELLPIYMAALTKFSIENKSAAKDQFAMKVSGILMLLDYVENPNNKITAGKPIAKLQEAVEII